MMQAYRTENSYRSAARLSPAELRAAMASGEILQATALAFDTRRQLRFELGGVKAVMPFAQCADGAETGTVRDIAVLTRVGRPTCFVIEGLDTDEDGAPCYRLSRAEAQRLCKAEYLDTLSPGDILPCTVTHIEPFGAFCDVGCGISALLPIDCMSVSRISSPADRVSVGQQILCAIKNRDAQGRFVLTIRELLGTWAENAARFTVGETVVGIVRSTSGFGGVPYVTIALAVMFAVYAAIKKSLTIDSIVSTASEILMMVPVALLFVLFFRMGNNGMGSMTVLKQLLMIGGGIVTGLPMVFYAIGVRHLPLMTTGICQYISRTLSLLCGAIMGEALTRDKLISFLFIWAGVILYVLNTVYEEKQKSKAAAQ